MPITSKHWSRWAAMVGTGGIALILSSAAGAQPVAEPAAASAPAATPRTRPAPVPRPAPKMAPKPDAITQPGLGQPTTPQVRIPFGKKPPEANPRPDARPPGTGPAPAINDSAARCEAMRSEPMRLQCLEGLTRKENAQVK